MNKRYQVYGVDAIGNIWDIYSYNNKEEALTQAKISKRDFFYENEFIYIQDRNTGEIIIF